MRIGWIRTFSGKYVSLLKPEPSMIEMVDIAHHLAVMPRWAGATKRPYVVAEHSIWVAKFVAKMVPSEIVDLAIVHALFHDAHEAYLLDIPTPMKVLFRDGYLPMAMTFDVAIWEHFQIPFRQSKSAMPSRRPMATWRGQRLRCF